MDGSQEINGQVSEAGRIDLFLSRRITGIREARGVSAETFASQLDMHPDLLNAYESGARKIPATLLFRISQVHRVSLSYIFSDESLTNPPVFNAE